MGKGRSGAKECERVWGETVKNLWQIYEEAASRILKSLIIAGIAYYTLWGVALHHGLLHPCGLIESPNPRTGRTHYLVFRIFHENNRFFELLSPVKIEE